MTKFNTTLLAKQGWRLFSHPDSLLARVLKSKYFPATDFLKSELRNNPLYIWKSLWATKGVLFKGVCWKVGTGSRLLILKDLWIPNSANFKINYYVPSLQHVTVSELIVADRKQYLLNRGCSTNSVYPSC